jgi:hypothetical protein
MKLWVYVRKRRRSIKAGNEGGGSGLKIRLRKESVICSGSERRPNTGNHH